MAVPFRDRRDAGRQLAAKLNQYRSRDDLLVLALPRGGVPVADEVARALAAPLDLFLVRKLGVPGHEELAMGAIASGGLRLLNEELVADLHLPEDVIEAVVATEQRELARRERLYRGTRPEPDVTGKTVILVDDGMATGSTMRAAAEALRQRQPARIVAAVPVAAPVMCEAVQSVVDETVCAITPEQFYAVGVWYEDFSPTSDDEVQRIVQEAEERQRHAHPRASSRGPAAARDSSSLVDLVSAVARPLGEASADLDPLLALIGDARFALIGEASHGTHEFYQTRAALTRRLVTERGFTAIAVEADWPDAYRVNRYVQAASDDADADAALADFQRFPRWMWRNTVVRDFVSWLRQHNDGLPADRPKTGFYGLDLYSLHASIEEVLGYLDKVDPVAADRARRRYACFDHFGDDAQLYGLALSLGTAEPCEDEVVNQLLELQRRATDLARRDGRVAEDEFFYAEQNARLARNAEAYYRSMFRGRVSSWNLRDRHMAETLAALVDHLGRAAASPEEQPKVVVWAHNSHLGDARATQMGAGGEINLGQLARERYGRQAVLVGFSTYTGTVTAASDWGAPAERKRVRPGLPSSYEALFHDVAEAHGQSCFLLTLTPKDSREVADRLRQARLQRAIGVIYRPETERLSHYFDARLSDQFDALLHLDETRALEPLEPTEDWNADGTTENAPTFPFGQ